MAVNPYRSQPSFSDRYRKTVLHIDDSVVPGRKRYGIWKPPDINMSSFDRYAVVETDLMRPDFIAWKTYGDVSLWWVIMHVNSIANPFTDLIVGEVLKIPKIEFVTAALAKDTLL
jgi:hypothetical protein